MSKIQSFLLLKDVKCLMQDRTVQSRIMTRKGDCHPAATTKFLFGMCDSKADNDVGTVDFPLVLGILHVCSHAHVRSHASPGIDCIEVEANYSIQRKI